MQRFREIPATLLLIIINILVFVYCYITVGSFEEPQWSFGLLKVGALFNPYVLNREWYRIFASMFLHGHLLHLALNMYGLFAMGSEIESSVGTKKVLAVYFVAGVASALTTLYFNLFTLSVGASGAIFGLFGFMLMVTVFISRKEKLSLVPILTNFLVFVGINLLMAKAMHADSAAHVGGFLAGVLIGLFGFIPGSSFSRIRIEYVMGVLLVGIYVALPRYQVTYFNFFQKILDIEEASTLPDKNLTDKGYVDHFKRNILLWDTALMMLDAHAYLPTDLSQDTFKLRRYIHLRKAENNFRQIMIERESYIYLDSVAVVQDSMKLFSNLDYIPSYRLPSPTREPEQRKSNQEISKVWYDSNWVEIQSTPGSFYRMGYKDSLGRWQGAVRDYYANGNIQMMGAYKDGKSDGIFIYYSDHKTYDAAGRFVNNRRVGKWENYHHNGKLASEVFYSNGYRVRNMWDSLGQSLVKDGNGGEVRRHSNGVIETEGKYVDGYQQGYWYGRHLDGTLYYEENYHKGRLVNGRSRNLKGETFYYDESSQFPLPEGGYEKLYTYLAAEADREITPVKGTVRLSFRVTTKTLITDLAVEKSLTPFLDERAKEFLLAGPPWIPAKLHGQEAVDGTYFVNVVFGAGDTPVDENER